MDWIFIGLRLVNGAYTQYEILGNGINSNGNDFTPWIHPDEKVSYICFRPFGGIW